MQIISSYPEMGKDLREAFFIFTYLWLYGVEGNLNFKIKPGRRFIGEYSITDINEGLSEGSAVMDIDKIPGIIMAKDPYEIPYIINRTGPRALDYYKQQTFRRFGSDSQHSDTDLRVKHFDLSHPNLTREYFAMRNFPRGSIYFRIDQSVQFSKDELYLIKKAMLEIEKFTCIRFFYTTDDNVERKKLVLERHLENSCVCHRWSGKIIQRIGLGAECFTKKHYGIVHQLLHGMGFDHMHNAFDRDRYVRFKWNHIDISYRQEFLLKLPMAATLALKFDYDSVMAVPLHYASKTGGATIIPLKKHGRHMGDVSQLSKWDVIKLRLLYDDECDLRIGPLMDTMENKDNWDKRYEG